MVITLSIIIVLLVLILLFVAAIQPSRSKFSMFELERRSNAGDGEASRALKREALIDNIVWLQSVIIAIILIIITIICVQAFGWLISVPILLLIALEYRAVAYFGFVRKLSNKLYNRIEKHVLTFIQKAPYMLILIRGHKANDTIGHQTISSPEELQYIISKSENILTLDQKNIIVNSLSFHDQLVDTIMTPRAKISSINKSEFLGPLTLNDLQHIGHSCLPVIDGDIDNIIGILHLDGLLTLQVKRSKTAERAMEPKVYYVRQDHTLLQALTAFLRTRSHLLIVINESRETVGLLTLDDIIHALIGRKIIDDFGSHDNLRAVASHKKG